MTITLQAVNELIKSLESAGELSIKERKYLDIMRWAVGVAGERDAALNAERAWETAMMEVCGEDGSASVASEIRSLRALRDTAIQALNSQVEQLAAENVAMLRLLTDISENHVEYFSEGEDGMFAGVPLDYVSEINMYVSRDVNAENPFPATDAYVDGIKACAIPEGFKLVPEQMYLSAEDIQAICMQCGNGDQKGYGDYEDGILWVGELINDGEMKYGLNIANANYPEEGSITVFEFDEQLREVAK